MTARFIGFWTGVNAALLYVNLFDAATKQSLWHLAMALLSLVGLCVGIITREAA